jgi:hypothetical protein
MPSTSSRELIGFAIADVSDRDVQLGRDVVGQVVASHPRSEADRRTRRLRSDRRKVIVAQLGNPAVQRLPDLRVGPARAGKTATIRFVASRRHTLF